MDERLSLGDGLVVWRVLIVDDFSAVRHLLRNALEALPEFQVCGEADNGEVGIEQACKLKPHAIILDISMPVMNGLDAAKILRSLFPEIKIVMFTTFEHANLSDTVSAQGANAVVSKTSSPATLARILRELLRPA